MKAKEPTRKHPEIKELMRRQRSQAEKGDDTSDFKYGCLGFAIILGIAICSYCLLTKDRGQEVSNKPVVAEEPVATDDQTHRQRRAEDRIRESLRTPNRRKVERKSVELFPIQEIKVLKDASSSVWSLVGTVRNNTDHPVKGIVRIRFLDKTGYVFHKSQNIVAGPKGITAIQTGEIPLLPEPEWIRPGEFGWFIHPEDHIVFEEAANIEVTFEKVSN